MSRYIRRREQAHRANCSIKTLIRWGKDPSKRMPPEHDIPGGPARNEDLFDAWLESRAVSHQRENPPNTTHEFERGTSTV